MTPPAVPAVPADTHSRRDRGVSVSGRRIAYPSSDSAVPFPRHAASPDTKLFIMGLHKGIKYHIKSEGKVRSDKKKKGEGMKLE